jgi:hypothetical protein
MNKRVVAISGLVAILSGTPISNTYAAPGPTQKDLDNAAMDAKNWLSADRDYYGQRYSALNPANSPATCASFDGRDGKILYTHNVGGPKISRAGRPSQRG